MDQVISNETIVNWLRDAGYTVIPKVKYLSSDGEALIQTQWTDTRSMLAVNNLIPIQDGKFRDSLRKKIKDQQSEVAKQYKEELDDDTFQFVRGVLFTSGYEIAINLAAGKDLGSNIWVAGTKQMATRFRDDLTRKLEKAADDQPLIINPDSKPSKPKNNTGPSKADRSKVQSLGGKILGWLPDLPDNYFNNTFKVSCIKDANFVPDYMGINVKDEISLESVFEHVNGKLPTKSAQNSIMNPNVTFELLKKAITNPDFDFKIGPEDATMTCKRKFKISGYDTNPDKLTNLPKTNCRAKLHELITALADDTNFEDFVRIGNTKKDTYYLGFCHRGFHMPY
jgi:hypothetical protein